MNPKILKGLPVSVGIAIGEAVIFGNFVRVPKRETDAAPELEWQKYLQALNDVDVRITAIQSQMLTPESSEIIEIFDAHKAILNDPVIRESVDDGIFKRHSSAAWAVTEAFIKIRALISKLTTTNIAEKVSDIDSVRDLLLESILDENLITPDKFYGKIVVSRSFTPKDILQFARCGVIGIISETGSLTSHVAILAKNLNIPTVLGVDKLTSFVKDGNFIALDAFQGVIELEPTEDIRSTLERKKSLWFSYNFELREKSKDPCLTLDKFPIGVYANIEGSHDAEDIVGFDAVGVGLLRLEYFYLSKKNIPTEDEIYNEICTISEKIGHRELTVRLLDAGGDKDVPSLSIYSKASAGQFANNPAMSSRGIRLLLKLPEVLSAQCRAIIRANTRGNIRLMVPFVTSLNEVRSVTACVQNAWKELNSKHQGTLFFPKVGIMVEVPAAVSIAYHLAKEVDFFSIGTNDLIQHTLAVDRTDISVAHFYEPLHPGVIKFIADSLREGDKAQIPVSMCGEMASNPLYVELLVGLGLKHFSSTIKTIPLIKEVIRKLNLMEATTVAKQVLLMNNAEDIRSYLLSRFKERFDFERFNPSYED